MGMRSQPKPSAFDSLERRELFSNSYPLQVYGVGRSPRDVVRGDFDGDSRQDVVVANFRTLSFFRGRGDGTFADAVTLLANDYVQAITAADFNGDGKLDVATAGSTADAWDVTVLLNDGTGGFEQAVHYADGDGLVDIVTGDFNGDDHADLAIASSNSDQISIMLNAGDGTFPSGVEYASGDGTNSITVADFNGDDVLDLAFANSGPYINSNYPASYLSTMLGVGDGSFSPATQLSGTGSFVAVTAIDWNRDGFEDIASTNVISGNVVIKLNDGTGHFPSQLTASTSIARHPRHTTVGDFNQDGRPDLVVACSGATQDASILLIYLNTSGTTLGTPVALDVGDNPGAVTTASLNGDENLDLVIASDTFDRVAVLLANDDGTFTTRTRYPVAYLPQSLRTSDFNQDGRADLVYTWSNASGFAVALADATGGFAAPVTVTSGYATFAVETADINGDGKTDVVAAQATGQVVISLGDGNGGFAAPATYATGEGAIAVAIGDFNGDARPDLAVARGFTNTVTVLLALPAGGFGAGVNYAVTGNPRAIVAADTNGDGKTDLATANADSGDAAILVGNGNGTFLAATRRAAGLGATAILARDFNGDGRADLAVANPTANSVTILLAGSGSAAGASFTFAASSAPKDLTAADVNGDGLIDFAVATSGAPLVLLSDGAGQFIVDGQYIAGTEVTSITAGDFNGDGRADLAVAEHTPNNAKMIGVLPNRGTFLAPLSASFDVESLSASFRFNEQLDPTALDLTDLTFTNRTTGVAVSPTAVTLSGDGRTATFHFATSLTDGNYDLKLLAGSIQSEAQKLLQTDVRVDRNSTFILAGDANRDRKVSFADLVILAQNYNQTGKTFSQGNFDYSADGKVDFADLVLLAQRYNTTLAAFVAPATLTAAPSSAAVVKANRNKSPGPLAELR